ncbi:hypothetical protein F4677DRAFT_433270 [Hypoxylon crocopeplum]|nr:hypothetical protein F4677DRAFT_433270 [Hypoxylon crocopeplum]
MPDLESYYIKRNNTFTISTITEESHINRPSEAESAMDRSERTRSYSFQSSHKDDGYDALVDIMAEMRTQGVEIPLVVRSLATQLYETGKAAEERADHLASKYMRLQAEHAQLAAEFNDYCKDVREGWRAKVTQSLYKDMRRTVDSAAESSQQSRDAMKRMFYEHMAMTTEAAALQMEVATLRKENKALKAGFAVAKHE